MDALSFYIIKKVSQNSRLGSREKHFAQSVVKIHACKGQSPLHAWF